MEPGILEGLLTMMAVYGMVLLPYLVIGVIIWLVTKVMDDE